MKCFCNYLKVKKLIIYCIFKMWFGRGGAFVLWHLKPHTSHLTPHTWHLTPDTWHLTPDTWHLTPDTWHLTCDTWSVVNILSTFQLPSSCGLGVMMFWRFGAKGLGQKKILAENSEILIFAIYLVWKGHFFFVEKGHVSACPRFLI